MSAYVSVISIIGLEFLVQLWKKCTLGVAHGVKAEGEGAGEGEGEQQATEVNDSSYESSWLTD